MTDTIRRIESWPISKVRPYSGNAKKHPEEQIRSLARAIKEHGWDQPIVVDGAGIIIKGHGRRLAAIHLEMTHVPVIVRDDLTPEQANAARLSDNRVVSLEYDTELLRQELDALFQSAAVDMSALGFDERELAFLTADLSEISEDSFVDDIAGAAEEQSAKNEDITAEISERGEPLSKAMGLTRVNLSTANLMRRFMEMIQSETGATGEIALNAWLKDLLSE